MVVTSKRATGKPARGVRNPDSPKTPVEYPINGTHEVLFLLPWDWTRPYFSRLIQRCENAIAEIDGVRPVIRCLHRDPDGDLEEAVTAILDRELKWVDRDRLLALVVAPTGAKDIERSIARFCAGEDGEKKIQPIALSLPFHHKVMFKHHGAPEPIDVWITAKNRCEKLGHGAAQRFLMVKPNETVLKLLCIAGMDERIDSKERLAGFTTGLTDEIKHQTKGKVVIQSLEAKPCAWDRDLTREEVTRLLGEGKIPDIIFCASDQMSLGARDALLHFHDWPDPRFANDISVYGFDGIRQVLELLDKEEEPFLRGTLRQAIPVISSELRKLVAHLNQNEPIKLRPLTSADAKWWKCHDQAPKANRDVVRPFRSEEQELWVDEEKAGELDNQYSASSLRQKRTALKYAGDSGKGTRRRIKGTDSNGEEWCIDEDERHSRKPLGKHWMYLRKTLKKMP